MSDITKKAMEASLIKLLNQKPLNKITVSNITDDCGISRMTFYYHFSDIYELLEWSFDDIGKTVLKTDDKEKSWRDCLLDMFSKMRENRTLIMNVFRSVNKVKLDGFLFQSLYGYINSFVESSAEGMRVSKSDCDFIANTVKYALIGTVENWINAGMKEDPQYIVDKLAELYADSIPNALKNAQRARLKAA